MLKLRRGKAEDRKEMPSYPSSSQKLWGIFRRKERWGLSWRGWVLVISVGLVAAYLVFLNIYPFLAVTHRVNSRVLVVEGWVHPYAIRAGAEEFRTGFYARIFTTGGPVEGSGGYINDYNTSASVGGEALQKRFGVPDEFVQMVPSHVIGRDRTYNSAAALCDWLREHDVAVPGVNIVTEDVHARRTRFLFQKALGRNVTVGIIAVPNPDYDAKHWWHYGQGVRDVLSEGIAYIYAKLIFYPSQSLHHEKTERTSQSSR